MIRAWRLLRRVLVAAAALLPAYAAFAYVVVPAAWSRHLRRSAAADVPGLTYTAERLPADPLNVALVGSREDLLRAMEAAGWSAADAISFRSGLRDAGSIVFHRPYVSAPMSTHFLWNRAQDLAFERIVGGSPRRRHHVRFWRSGGAAGAREVWIGAASYDRELGFSRYTGEVVHHIDEDLDAERRTLIQDLARAGRLERSETVAAFRPAGTGINGGGDFYRTDGALAIGVLSPGSLSRPGGPRAR
jgi:hypothetical protein